MKLSDNEKRLWAAAQESSRNDDQAGALAALKELLNIRPESAIFCASYANALKETGQLEAALDYFRRAVTLNPAKELFSLSLFHCLWKQEKYDEAFDEIRRFQLIGDSADYREIIKAINEKWSKEIK